jgi:hypothetical protein
MRNILTILAVFIFTYTAFSQQVFLEKAIQKTNNNQTDNWGTDVVISAFEPIGQIETAKLGNTIYVAVNDTLATSNLGIVIFKSSNNGANWTMNPTGFNIREKIDRMVFTTTGTGPDSLYLFIQRMNTIIRWNVVSGSSIQILTPNYFRTFDVVGSSTGALYLFGDVLTSNSIPRYTSLDGGWTWGSPSTVTSSGAIPRVSQMIAGDSTILNYYNTATIVGSDTTTASIRSARYRQTANGTLSSANFQDVATETVPKTEYKSVKLNNYIWLIYTTGTTGNINILGRKSDNAGVNYSAPVNIATNTNVDEYWFDAGVFTGGSGGFDLIYYSDSLQSGPPTNGTDKIMYKYSNLTDPGFSAPVQISTHPPEWSSKGYIPVIVEIPTTDIGVVWVGLDGTSKKVYFDRYALVSGLINNNNETPQKYTLEQNYPNPFNPVTNIKFGIPENGSVQLKVYDILGKEVAELVNEKLNAGIYEVKFDAGSLSSGIYFYKLETQSYKETKKMILIK